MKQKKSIFRPNKWWLVSRVSPVLVCELRLECDHESKHRLQHLRGPAGQHVNGALLQDILAEVQRPPDGLHLVLHTLAAHRWLAARLIHVACGRG